MKNIGHMISAGLSSLWLPTLVYVGAGLVMIKLSGHDYVKERLNQKAASEDRRGLNMRLRGYDTDAVARQWSALDERALQSERRFLQLDLAFPLFYGGALAIALRQAWMASGRSFPGMVPIAVIALTMIADWTENLIQLSQLRLFEEHGAGGLQDVPIQIASAATTVKILFFTSAVLLIIILAISRVLRLSKADSQRVT
jgi:hypothetical protein